MASAACRGPAAAPRRHPVMANFLENVKRMTQRSSMPSSETSDRDVPS